MTARRGSLVGPRAASREALAYAAAPVKR
jgi:hypothetical protein